MTFAHFFRRVLTALSCCQEDASSDSRRLETGNLMAELPSRHIGPIKSENFQPVSTWQSPMVTENYLFGEDKPQQRGQKVMLINHLNVLGKTIKHVNVNIKL